ncbi:uncharacterized protein KY384_006903 [Bacidia gigantensis]|uniref:uncharacterized protein n=1 Tax=Bacidia gigantensis TaxID=2732470 RepID=UPI001D053CE7|nr:uncharacterized protein KY384_006903 [Bacidia gigantensis]KAG8527987.1 hypothetical protein KY384_006903 [Bacidia gigantensis]
MGRYDFRPLRVHQTATQQFQAQKTRHLPPWHGVIGAVPPTQILVRGQPVPHQRRKKGQTKKSSKLFQPQKITYEEDEYRADFFTDHPWELARPRMILENDGKDSQKTDWRQIRRPEIPLSGESVVQRQMWLQHDKPEMSKSETYDQARKEFYELRLLEDTERRVAREEALMMGAQFGLSPMEVGMKLEDDEYERWKVWAQQQTELDQQRNAAMFVGTETADMADASREEGSAALEEVSDAIPVQGQNAEGGAMFIHRYEVGARKPLTTRECIEAFEDELEKIKQAERQLLAGSGFSGDGTRLPKLSLPMSKRNLASIPSEVISMIRDDVARLNVSHNQLNFIFPEFATCSALKYLNLRDNRFQEIPQAILSLGQLEILDVSHNHIRIIPDEISNLKVLRVFSIRHNAIEDLPPSLGKIKSLRMLKVDGNNWKEELVGGVEKITQASGSPMPANSAEEETFITSCFLQYLREKQTEVEQLNDGPLETPKALSRFPVNPNDAGYLTNGLDPASGPRSPGYSNPSIRSHSRGASSQHVTPQNGALRRPGLAPLTLSNERNRSNSESVLQATYTRTKRMGMVPKKRTELQVLDENRAQRNSYHLRGQSHSSALRNVLRPGDNSPNSDANRNSGQNGIFIRRLSSVPEQKQHMQEHDGLIQCAKGVLYSLHLVQPHLSPLVAVAKESNSKRTSLERTQHQASVHLEDLDHSLHDFAGATGKGRKAKQSARKKVCQAIHASLSIYGQIAGILLKSINQLIVDCDPRYVRTLMLLLYGSTNEKRNARRTLPPKQSVTQDTLKSIPPSRQPSEPRSVNREDALTPTQNHPRPGSRLRNGSVTKQTLNQTNIASVLNPQRHPLPSSTASSRASSRSASRTGHYFPPSSASSIIGTPRSGESFGGALPVPRSRQGSVSLHSERSQQLQPENDMFEKIFLHLQTAVGQSLDAIAFIEPRVLDNLNASRKQYSPINIQKLWERISSYTQLCGGLSESLNGRLQQVKVNDPDARNAPGFWRLTARFVHAYSDLAASLKEARRFNQMDPELRHRLRPVHTHLTLAWKIIERSPWQKFTGENLPPSQVQSRAPTPVQTAFPTNQPQVYHPPVPYPSMATHQHYQHRRPNGSHESGTESVSSPQNGSVPATPLSAALGTAAQATIPKTPASSTGRLDMAFEGNFFQRADTLLLNGQQTMLRRPSGAP